MTTHQPRTAIAEFALVSSEPQLTTRPTDRTFELPTGLYGATVGGYLAFLAVMALGFSSDGLILPMAVCVFYIVMAFGVPSLWVRMQPSTKSRALTWQQFRRQGIQTGSGWLPAGAAAAQVLVLPLLVLLWGVAAVIVKALV